MCNFLSAIVTRDGRVLWHPMTDSHTDLIAHFNLREGVNAGNFVRVEFTPPLIDGKPNHLDVKNYKLKLDEQSAPTWYDDERALSVREKLTAIVREMIVTDDRHILLGGCYILCGAAKVNYLKSSRVVSMYDTSRVVSMYDTSSVGSMYDTSSVVSMYDTSSVGLMYGTSSVGLMYGTSSVGTMYDTSRVVSMCDTSSVPANMNPTKDKRQK